MWLELKELDVSKFLGVELAFPWEEAVFEMMAFSVGRNKEKSNRGTSCSPSSPAKDKGLDTCQVWTRLTNTV